MLDYQPETNSSSLEASAFCKSSSTLSIILFQPSNNPSQHLTSTQGLHVRHYQPLHHPRSFYSASSVSFSLTFSLISDDAVVSTLFLYSGRQIRFRTTTFCLTHSAFHISSSLYQSSIAGCKRSFTSYYFPLARKIAAALKTSPLSLYHWYHTSSD